MKENPLVIECYDFNSSGNHKSIGILQKTVADLEQIHREQVGANFYSPPSFGQNHKKMLKGQLFVDRYCENVQYRFLDYISNGFELNFMVAIDFTASNGSPGSPESLHYIDPLGRPNAYQQAIFEVGEVLQFYDSDRRFSAWGFGGRPMHGQVSHCFNLNGSPVECEVEGVEGIMFAYCGVVGVFNCQGAAWCKVGKTNLIHDEQPGTITGVIRTKDIDYLPKIAEDGWNGIFQRLLKGRQTFYSS